MRTTPEEQSQQISNQYRSHIVKKIRDSWGSSVPADASDDEVLDVWRELNVPSDATQEDINDVIQETYGKDFVPAKLEDHRTFGEKASDVAGAVGPAVASLGANIGAAVGAAAPGMAKIAKVAGKSVPAQLGMAGYYGTQLAGEHLAGKSLEKTAAGIPEPNIAELRAKGYSEQQIRNIVNGYVATQQSLMGDVQEMGERGVGTAAEAIGNAAVLPMGVGAAERLAANAVGKAAAKAGVKAGLGHVAGKVAERAVGGALIGGTFGGVDSVVHRATEAVQAGQGADTILGHMTKGILGPDASNVVGAVAGQPTETAGAFGKGFGETWKFGAALGGSLGAVEGATQVGKAASNMRKMKEAEAVRNARLVSVQKFADEFQTGDVLDRFNTDVVEGVAQGQNAVQIATAIVSKLHPDVAATEQGMKTIAEVANKLEPAVAAYQKTAEMNRPLLPTRQGIGSDESVEAAEGFQNYLNEGDFRPDTALPGPRPEGFEPNNAMRPAFSGLPPQQMELAPPQPQVRPATLPGPEGALPPAVQPGPMVPGLEGRPPVAAPQGVGPVPGLELPAEVQRPALPEPVADQRLGNPGAATGSPAVPVSPPQPEPAYTGPEGALPPAVSNALTPGNLTPERPAQFVPPSNVPQAELAPKFEAPPKVDVSPVQKDLSGFPGIHVEAGPDHITIKSVVTHNDVPSSTALKAAIKSSDHNNVPLKVELAPQAGPKGGMIPVEKQAAWYKSHGFRELPGAGDKTVMWRDPIGEHQSNIADTMDKVANAAQKRIESRKGRLNAGFDPADIRDHSLVLAADMFSQRLRNKAAIESWAVEKWGESIKPHLDKIVAAAQKHFVRMFKTNATAEKNLKTLLDLKESGKHGFDWYENTADWAKQKFGEDADMMLRFLAVTSANGQTEAGAALALKAFAQWKAGMPFEGFRGDSMVGQLNRIVKGENLGEHTKIQNFYDALKGDPNAIVLDRWMMDALNLKDKGGNLRENDYRIYAQVIDDLAEMNGMTPRQFQAAVWEGARVRKAHITEKTGGRYLTTKSGSARPLEELVDRKLAGMSIDQYIEANHGNLKQMENLYQGLAPVRKGENSGHTFDPKTWEPDTQGGYVTSLASTVVDKKELYPATVLKFAKQFEPLVKEHPDKHFTVGVFKMPDGNFSIDLNTTLKNESEAKALALSNRQHAVGKLAEGGAYEGDIPTGYNPKKHGPQFLPPKEPGKRAAWLKREGARIGTLLRSTGVPEVRNVAEEYKASRGISTDPQPKVKADPERGKRIAEAYEALPAVDPKARSSYDALNKETAEQYQKIKAAGFKIEFVDKDPYKNSAEMMADLRDNKTLKVLKSSEAPHPFMTKKQNDIFRAVHDFFGHAENGFQFGANGEESAFRSHARMYSPAAVPALATETRGQNSWVNYGPHAGMAPAQRPFAAQKAALLPREFYSDVLPRKE